MQIAGDGSGGGQTEVKLEIILRFYFTCSLFLRQFVQIYVRYMYFGERVYLCDKTPDS